MPLRRFEWLRRIKGVEREHAVAQLAVDRLLNAAMQQPSLLTEAFELRDIRQAVSHLEGTYIIRLFAEFETGLRTFWSTARKTDPPARTRDLLDGIAATRRIPPLRQANAHVVREYRNHLVHLRGTPVASMTIADARRSLCMYFSFLPPDW